mgnify:CR=1 FL=1
MGKISTECKKAAKRKFKVWNSAYASGWGVRCTKAGGPGKMDKSKIFKLLKSQGFKNIKEMTIKLTKDSLDSFDVESNTTNLGKPISHIFLSEK